MKKSIVKLIEGYKTMTEEDEIRIANRNRKLKKMPRCKYCKEGAYRPYIVEKDIFCCAEHYLKQLEKDK